MSDAAPMRVECAHTELVDIDLLVPNPRNVNRHPPEQIRLLAKVMAHQGWRNPVVVSARSGFVVKGHGRLEAARANGWGRVPVDRQEYATEADEWADMVADNRIAELAEIDSAGVLELLGDLGDEFDAELLGFGEDALQLLRPGEVVDDPTGEWVGMPEFQQDDQMPSSRLVVNFRTESDRHQFATLVQQPLSEKTKYIWFPPIPKEARVDKQYVSGA